MKHLLALLLLAGLLGACLGACNDEPPPPVEPEPPRAEAPRRAPVFEVGIEPSADEVPIAEDFEEQAVKEVSPKDLKAQLDALEQEIASDGQ